MSGFVSGVDFVVVATQDIERSEAFYRDVLGLEFGKRWGNMPGVEYETGNLTLALMQSKAFGLEFAPNGVQPIAFNYKNAISGSTPVYLRPGDTVVVPD